MSSPVLARTVGGVLLASALAPALSALPVVPEGFCHLPPFVPPAPSAGQYLGTSVAMDATTAVLGAPGGSAVYVYERAGGQWLAGQTLLDPLATGAAFGQAVALDGDRLFVGAPQHEDQGDILGAVHVYERGLMGWEHVDVLFSPTPAVDGRFGASLSAHNEWLAVGAPGDGPAGRAHVFSFESGSAQHVRSAGSFGTSGDFGWSVALHRPEGSTSGYLFVGDPFDNQEGFDAGTVRYFRVHPAELAFGAVLTPPGLVAGDVFGISIAFDGAHLVVGATGDDEVGASAGAAYVYDVPPPGPLVANYAGKLTGAETEAADGFGRSVAVRGSRIAVGADLQDQPSEFGGKVHLFRPALFGSAWTYDRMLEPVQGTGAMRFGRSVALDGHLVLVGASNAHLPSSNSGGAYMISTASELSGGLCPVPSLYTTTEYGQGKAGPQGVPTLGFNSPAVPGESTVLALKGFSPGVSPILMIGLTPVNLPFDGGSWLVLNPIQAYFPPVGVSGQIGLGWDVPNDLSLVGVPIVMQAMGVDPALVGGWQTAQTRGLSFLIGY